ncbi:DNA repair protein rad14 [Coemansia pectinata]|uniref:DNA repair protein rad14 n=1 Tax=Coemansia pectinata TaxID=1052879 RepID=A0A9W8LD98_9FUNG|nr:DNA repair protein rad14 [Coemansia pectinata]
MSKQLTTEQLAQIEANRLQALERRKQKTAAASPATVESVDKTVKPKRLVKSKMSSGYYEYDFSKMNDTRAGFLEEDSAAAGSPEKKRKVVSIDDIPFNPDPSEATKCCECGSIDLDMVYLKVFKVMVCKPCVDKIPDKYSLLTKTEAKEDYLLTDSELRDRELFPVWEKANPHKSTWNNMLLYMRQHLELFAAKKWDGLENLDKEFERRIDEKRERKEKKYKQSVANLRRRTRVEEWEKTRRQRLNIDNTHEHVYEPIDDGSEQKCTICGMVIEVEMFEF